MHPRRAATLLAIFVAGAFWLSVAQAAVTWDLASLPLSNSSIVRAMTANRDALSDRLSKIDALTILTSERPILPLMICKVNDDEGFTGTDLVGELARRNGWLVPAYKMPPKNDQQQILRMLIKVNQTRELSDALADDFEDSVKFLREKASAGDLSGPKPAPHTGHAY